MDLELGFRVLRLGLGLGLRLELQLDSSGQNPVYEEKMKQNPISSHLRVGAVTMKS